MKKFLVIATAVFILGVSFISELVTNKITLSDDSYFTKVVNEDFYIVKNGKWEKLELVGVNLDGGKPGSFPSENNVSQEEFLSWIKQIYDVGANCIKVSNLMSENFYNALNQFNEDKENPIYIVQGIYFDETNLKDGYDAQSNKLESLFKTNIKLIVDSIHGNPLNIDKPDILQNYKTDISNYVIGYTLGIEFAKHDIIYSEIMNSKNSYEGKYLYADEKSSSFESYLASIGDYLADYEIKTYKKQRLIGFIGSPYEIVSNTEKQEKNSVDSNDTKNKKLKEYIDPENIKIKRKFKSGIFAAYNVYPSYSELKEYKDDISLYLKKIEQHHTMPVIINEFGIPSSRSGGDFNKKGSINETQQGEALVEVYKAIKSSKCDGSFIFQFQDSWHNSSWNTKNNKILDRAPYWSDAQTYSQQFGLITFEPGRKKDIIYPDNSIKEWSQEDKLTESDAYSLSVKSDEKYLYLMIKFSKNIDLKKEDIFIDLDVTPKSGSKKSNQYNLKFENPVDFILKINDKKDAEVLVHEYYNNFNFYQSKKENMKRPDLINQTKNMDKFSKIYIETRPKMYIEARNGFAQKQIYESGKLVHGNGNPNSKDFNSVSDFYVGEKSIEVRIPWGLLNFMDPSTKQIQNDFYVLFETRPLFIDNIKVGLSIKNEDDTISRLNSGIYDLNGWAIPKYHERIKESYYIVQKELTKK
ncbi:MAG: hypothetical protein RRY11_10535 [Terrisporobacter sp.]